MKFVALLAFFVGAFCLPQPSQEERKPFYHSPPRNAFIPLNRDPKSDKLFETNPKLLEFSKRLDSLNGTEIISAEDREILEEQNFRGILDLVFPPCELSMKPRAFFSDDELPIWYYIFHFCTTLVPQIPFPRAFKIFIGLEDYHNLSTDELIQSFKLIGLAKGDDGILRISERMDAIRQEYFFPSFFMPFIANYAEWNDLSKIHDLIENLSALNFDRTKFFPNLDVSISFLSLLFDYHSAILNESNCAYLMKLEKISLHQIIFDQTSLKAFEKLLGKVADSLISLEIKDNQLGQGVNELSSVFQFNNLKELSLYNSSLFSQNFQFKNHHNYTRLCLYDQIEFLNDTKRYFISSFTWENHFIPFLDLIFNQENLIELRISPFLHFNEHEFDMVELKLRINSLKHLKILEFKPPMYLHDFFDDEDSQIEELILQNIPLGRDWLSLLALDNLKCLRIKENFQFTKSFSKLIQFGRFEKIYVVKALIEPIKEFLTSMKSQAPRKIELHQIINSLTEPSFDSLVYTYESDGSESQ